MKIYVELEVPSDFAKSQMRQTIEKEIAAGRWTWRQTAKNENKLNQKDDDKDQNVDVRIIEKDHKDRVFVFKESTKGESSRPILYAIPERGIISVKSQTGSENCYLNVNGINVQGSFEEFIKLIGERTDIE